MSNFDYLGLDGRALRLFLAVLEEGSVTRAAERLGMTQSAVSHTLDKLRAITGDPLFVKAGRGIVATAHAEALGGTIPGVLDALKGIASPPSFDPATSEREFIIAANDYQRDLLLPAVMRRFGGEAPGIRMRVMPSGMPTLEMLRENRCDLVLAPEIAGSNGSSDVLDAPLLSDPLVCFYDPAVRSAPKDLADYLASEHIGVRLDENERGDFERAFRALGIHRRVRVVVGNAAGVRTFMAGTELLAILPSLLGQELLQRFAWCMPPFEAPSLPAHMFWHRRHQSDAAHQWLRQMIIWSAEELRGAGLAESVRDADN